MNKHSIVTPVLASALLFGCGSDPEPTQALSATILHVNDTLSNLAPKTIDLTIKGQALRAPLGGAPRAVTAMNQITDGRNDIIRLHAGNSITGNAFYTLFEGEADAEFAKLACFDAIGIGSHDFNAGEIALKNYIDMVNRGGCLTTFLGSNISFKAGTSPLAKIKADDTVKEMAIKYINNEPVGIISINPAIKTSQSSSPHLTTKFENEEKTAQKLINQLHKSGVNKIILLSQLGYQADLILASNLNGVDVIIGSDSHTLMGDYRTIGLEASVDTYPVLHRDSDGKNVCIAHSWRHYSALGELNVEWNALGEVTRCAGTTHLLIDTPTEIANRQGEFGPLTESQTQFALNNLQLVSPLIPVQPAANIQSQLTRFEARVDDINRRVIANVTDNLCLERLPGEGRSQLCSAEQTREHGSQITPIVAKAFLQATRTADVAIQNAGGVRTDISQGDLTIGDAQNLLPFGNVLLELTMRGSEIKQVLEDAIDYSIAEGGTSGGFPYASGLRWEVDMRSPYGQRVRNLQVNSRLENNWEAIKQNDSYKVVTNNYIALGRDGYKAFGDVIKDGRFRDTYIYYTQAFVDYARRVKVISPLPLEEQPIQQFTSR